VVKYPHLMASAILLKLVTIYFERTRMDVRRGRGGTREAEETTRMNESRQTRGAAAAAGASTSSSRGGAHGLQWIAQQQHAKLKMAKTKDAKISMIPPK
jgi:hypothetical protein